VSVEEKHLTIEQIERLLGVQPGEARNPGEPSLDEAQRHLANCENCQKIVSTEKARDQALQSLKQNFPTRVSEDCPPEVRFYELAAGVLEDNDSEIFVRHATECDRCGPILRQAFEQLSAPQTNQESEVLASLRTSQPEWQERFGRTLATSAKGDVNVTGKLSEKVNSRWGFQKMVWAFGTLTVIVVSILAVAAIWRSRPNYTDSLLATAYTERRTLELRMPGATHAPLQTTRGSQSSSLDKPPALLEAENLIAIHLRAGTPSVSWLQAKVRADLLDGNYGSAVRTAEEAVDLDPNSSSLLNDLGSAYFERAEVEKSALDYGRAYDSLSKSLAKNPDDPVVLFNRAVVAERAHLYTQAENDWNHYLLTETDLAWQAEARARLAQLEHKLREQKDQSQKQLDSPEGIVEALSSGDQGRIDQVDSSADEYLKLAVGEWLPQLTSGRVLHSERVHTLQTASRLLGEDLRTRHSDAWLSDFLSEPSYPHVSEAMESLVRAMRANADGDHESAVRFASNAEVQFQRRGSESGRLRSAFETIYSNRLAAHGKECHDKAATLVNEARERNYVWIEMQTRLEAAACAAEISNVDESVVASQKALELARSSKYGNLELRAIVFAADLSGDSNKRLELVDEGLVTFWGGRYEAMRGYNLYAVMDTSADDLQLWWWDKAAIEQGLGLIEADPNVALRGLEHYRLARAELAIGETEEATRTSAKARSLFEKSASQTLATGASIDMAEAFVMKGRYHDAIELLNSAEPSISSFTQDVVLAKYYSTRAAAFLGDGQSVEAERALAPAMQLAKKGLASISEERDRFSWLQTFEPAYKSLAHLELQKDIQESFRWWEAFKGGSITKVDTAEQRPISIAAMQEPLPSFGSWSNDGTVLLSYATFPEGIAVWAYDGKQVYGRWLPGSASTSNIDSLARRFYEGCADRNSDPNTLFVQGRELYDRLIQPASQWIRGRSRIIVETDDALESIPFEALVDEQGKYLSDSYEIEYSPGLFYLAENRRPEQIDRQNHALVIGQSLGDVREGLLPLPGALDEAREVARRFDGPVLLLDGDATLPRIVQELPRAEVFHFAGHSIGSRQLSALLLAAAPNADGSRFLDARNFNFALLNQSRLVVLSGCSTANGIGIGLNDRESLARNALAAGVPNVVASRWLVDSVATSEWMRFFYADAIVGESISSAAKRARLTLKANRQWRHPFYWATFSVFV
jgi:CHAT domain-containing protein/Flp pilus assembly protein TadD